MTLRYDAFDNDTFLVIEGDTFRYLDLVAAGVAFDSAMMQPGYDDSSWLVAPQPFVVDQDPAATSYVHDGSTSYDEFGVDWGPNGFQPAGYTAPNGNRFNGTQVTYGPGDPTGYVTEVVARIEYTVPGNLPTFDLDQPNQWQVSVRATCNIDTYVDGNRTAFGNVDGLVAHHLNTFPTSITHPGRHLLAFHGAGFSFAPYGGFVASAMISTVGRISSAQRLRQFPRDDVLGGAPRPRGTSVQSSARQGWQGTYR